MTENKNTPANRMRLADKITQMRDGIRLHKYNERTEDKGGDVEVTEVEHEGKVVGRYVQHDGELLESAASDDAQSTGLHAEMAKKLGSNDTVAHTKPEDASLIAHEEQPESVENKDNQEAGDADDEMGLDNCRAVEDADTPVSGKPLKKTDESSFQYHVNFKDHAPSRKAGGFAQWTLSKKQLADILANWDSGVTYDARSVKAGGGKCADPEKHCPTAQARGNGMSVPLADYLERNPKNQGRALYDGVGRDAPGVAALLASGHSKVDRYDPRHPEKSVRALPTGQYDRIHSHYTLNVVPPKVGREILQRIHDRLSDTGQAVISVRRDSEFGEGKAPSARATAMLQAVKDLKKSDKEPPKEGDKPKENVIDYSKNKPKPKEAPALDYSKMKPPAPPKPIWKVKSEAAKEEKREKTKGAYKAGRRGEWFVKSDSLKKKFQVFMDSMRGFRDPLAKDGVQWSGQAGSGATNSIDAAAQNAAAAAGSAISGAASSLASGISNFITGTSTYGTPTGTAPSQVRKSESLRKADIIPFEVFKARMDALKAAPKRTIEDAVNEQHAQQRRHAERPKTLPVNEQGETMPHVLPPETLIPKTEKSSVADAAVRPTQDAAKTPTIKNVAETTIATPPLKRGEGLAKAVDKHGVDPESMQTFPDASQGLEKLKLGLERMLKMHGSAMETAATPAAHASLKGQAKRDAISRAERAIKYIKRGIDLTNTSIAARDSKEPKWSDLVGTGNPKVNQLGTITFGNTLPGFNCPGRGDCGNGFCYGMNGQQNMGGPLELRARNAGLIHRADFVQGAIHALKAAPKHMTMEIDPESFDQIKDLPMFKNVSLQEPQRIVRKNDKGEDVHTVKIKVRAGDTVRWHDTGDITNQKHADDMHEIMKAFPEKKFYLYTKSLHLDLSKLRALPNCQIIQSVGGKHDAKLDPALPHTKYFPSPDEAAAAGYHSVWWNDHPAVSGETNIALTPHGSGARKLDITEANKPLQKSSVDMLPEWVKHDQPDVLAQHNARGRAGKMRRLHVVVQSLAKAEPLAKPMASQAQRRAMHAAAAGESTLGIPKKVGKEFVASDKGGKLPEKIAKADIVKFPPPKADKPAEPVDSKPKSRAEKLLEAMKAHGQFGGADFTHEERKIANMTKLPSDIKVTVHTADQPGVVKPEFKAPGELSAKDMADQVKAARTPEHKEALASLEAKLKETQDISNKMQEQRKQSAEPLARVRLKMRDERMGLSGLLKLGAAMEKRAKKGKKEKKMKKSDELPGGLADDQNFQSLPLSEKFAILRGSLVESKEHGPKAAGEIASDHVAEHGPEYYNELDKMEEGLEKAKPATFAELKDNPVPPPHGTIDNLDAHEALHLAQRHYQSAQDAKAAGHDESAQYHAAHAEAYLKQHQELRDSGESLQKEGVQWSGQAGSGATNAVDAAAQNAAAAAGSAISGAASAVGNVASNFLFGGSGSFGGDIKIPGKK